MIADEETKKLIAENRALKARLEAVEGAPAPQPIPDKDLPQYLLIKPMYISSADQYIEEGETIVWTGVPNDAMEPKNPAAERNMRAWLESLPQGRVDHQFVIEASYMLRPREGEPVATMGEVMRKAAELQARHKGLPEPSHEVTLPHKVEDIPVVGNDERVAATKRKTSKDMVKVLPPEPRKKGPTKITGSPNENPNFS